MSFLCEQSVQQMKNEIFSKMKLQILAVCLEEVAQELEGFHDTLKLSVISLQRSNLQNREQ